MKDKFKGLRNDKHTYSVEMSLDIEGKKVDLLQAVENIELVIKHPNSRVKLKKMEFTCSGFVAWLTESDVEPKRRKK